MTSGSYFRVLRILHIALTMGVMFFLGVGSYITFFSPPITPPEEEFPFVYFTILLLISMSTVGIGLFVFRVILAKIPKQESLRRRLQVYQTAFLIKMALLEGPGLLSGVFLILTGKWIFVVVGVVLVAFMLMQVPTIDSVSQSLELPVTERGILENPQSIIE